jgi:hypothetical protein
MIVSPCLRAEWPEGPQAYEEGGAARRPKRGTAHKAPRLRAALLIKAHLG